MLASVVALQIMLILLPGFAGSYLVQMLASRRPQTDFERTVEAFLLSFLIYVAYMPCNGGRLPFSIIKATSDKEPTIQWEPANLALLAGVTLAIALLVTAYIRFDGNRIFRLFDTTNPTILRWLKWLKLTERTTRSSIWNDILESEVRDGQFVQVELQDGRSVAGLLMYYSDVAEDSSLYLASAAWVTQVTQIPIPGPGILLTKASGIRSVSLLDAGHPPAAEVKPAVEGKISPA